MSSQLSSLFLPLSASSTMLTFDLFIGVMSLVAIFGYWLVPGGLAWAFSKFRQGNPLTNKPAIPGPSGFPVVGLLSAFTGPLTHRVLAKLAHTFDAKPLMAFSVGFTRFIISSHPDTAKGILSSSAFADRPIKESAYELLFHRAMGFAPYGEYWRNLRRISATHMFSPKRIAASGEFRAEVGAQMGKDIMELMRRDGEVEVRKVLHFGSLNNVMMSVFGKSYVFGEGGDGCELEELVSEGYELLGMFNWSDHFPLLGRLDLQGVRKRCRSLVERVNVFVGKIIAEHREKRAAAGEDKAKDSESSGDFVDVLLDLEKENRLQHSDMVAVLWLAFQEMIFRGTDTVAILVEWILARMVVHPEIQAKAQSEIDSVVGCERSVNDDDLGKLPYVRAIVKETLRMHPPGPLLSWARYSIHDTEIGNHFVPAGTTAMVNMWAISHDKEVWSEPEEFKPERFVTEEVQMMGSDLRLAPFGSGRRVCPGKAMGVASVELWVAMLLQKLKWMSCDCGVDLSECLELSMKMKCSLITKVVPRPSVTHSP
ncbi:cytochrome P450 78A5 isoform X1 [Vigna angularis]|uniref:cytochrome P450 78A5 isoform X1 n=1 Tax=Phaseolus angularis TaxID=3914 RepID=UPI00080A7175|nr:cytochrome P450 78A5 isoform X1 [Vigna angularis]